jgi:hypothetical protein
MDRDLSVLSVKITAKGNFGSGFIYLPYKDSKFIYIITAKHCIYGYNFDEVITNKDVNIYFLGNDNSYRLSHPDKIISNTENDPDLAIIRVSLKKIAPFLVEIPTIPICGFNPCYLEADFKGFPSFTENLEGISDHINIIATDSGENVIQAVSPTRYGTVDSLSSINVTGFSGSGVLITAGGKFFLVGIVFKYVDVGNRFHITGLKNWITKVIPDVKIVDIELESKLSDEFFKNNIEKASTALGIRYSRDFSYPVPTMEAFSFLGADQAFKDAELKKFQTVFNPYFHYKAEISSLSNDIAIALNKIAIEGDGEVIKGPIKLKQIHSNIDEELLKLLPKIASREIFVKYDKSYGQTIYHIHRYTQLLLNLIHEVNNIKKDHSLKSIIDTLTHLSRQSEILLGYINENYGGSTILFIRGAAGSGKSHLLADVANKRIAKKSPTLLLLGQHFSVEIDPWSQILKALSYDGSIQEFLTLLNKKGELLNERVLIFIDAINEGEGIRLWPIHLHPFLDQVKGYEFIGIIFTHRSTYEDVLFDKYIHTQYSFLTHSGFAGFENEAFNAFADHYGLPNPRMPILNREFANPLFLKLFCLGWKNNGIGIRNKRLGIEDVFSFFIQHINKELGKVFEYTWYKINLVRIVIETMAEKMIEIGEEKIPYVEAHLLCNNQASQFLEKKKFLDALITNDIFIDEIRNTKIINEPTFYVAFSYQRLGDYLRAKVLVETAISKSSVLKEVELIINNPQGFNAGLLGLIDAIYLYYINNYNIELIQEVSPDNAYYLTIFQAFLYSLGWRKAPVDEQLLTDCFKKALAGDNRELFAFWDTNMELCLEEHNTINGRFLHKCLSSISLAERDNRWTIYIHDKYLEKNDGSTPISILIQWAWKLDEESPYSDEAILLGAITLTWLLSSNNRKLRDVATKALIHLFLIRPSYIVLWIKEFEEVDDPYIRQRVYAVTLGCIVKLDDKQLIKDIADYVYTEYFGKEEVFPDILERDYARQIVEHALRVHKDKSYSLKKIRPPYKSNLPTNFPSNSDIDNYLSKLPLDARGGVEKIIDSMITEYGRGTSNYGDFGRYQFGNTVKKWKDVDVVGLSNWGVKMIFEKYNGKLQGKFDAHILTRSREAPSLERIGKKYQWIVFYEILARLADNKKMDTDTFDIEPRKVYKGPWDPFVRDIDPTFLVNPTKPKGIFWKPELDLSDWQFLPNKQWLIKTKDLPNPLKTVQIKDEHGEEWFILHKYISWTGALQGIKYSDRYKDFYCRYQSFIIREADLGVFKKFIQEIVPGATNLGSMVPQPYSIFNREYYSGDAAQSLISDWDSLIYSNKNIGDVIPTTVEYLWEKEQDKSPDAGISFFKPSYFLYNLLQLKEGKQDGEYIDSDGKIVCMDPSIKYNTESCLIIHKKTLMKALNKHNLTLFWMISGEKRIIGDYSKSLEIAGGITIEDKLTYSIKCKLPDGKILKKK